MPAITITTTNSKITTGSSALASSVANSTLTVNDDAYLISLTGGDGANLIGFTAVTVDGVLEGDGTSYDGLSASLGMTSNAMALTIGASGEIFGDYDGVFSDQTITIANSGILEGSQFAGIDESYSNAAASSVSNAVSGQVMGASYGIRSDGAGLGVTESVANSGLVQGLLQAGIFFLGDAAAKIVNAASGRILGKTGIDDSGSTGAQRIVNAGLIEGGSGAAIFIEPSGGGLNLSNSATGTISGDVGIYDFCATSSSRTLSNAGGVFGGDAIDEFSNGTLTLTNAATGRIVGSANGIFDDGATGARTIKNSGVIQGADGYGLFEATAGTNLLNNLSGGQIIGGGTSGYGIYDGAALGVQTIDNAGLLIGGEYALYTGNSTTVHFVNSGIVEGDVDLTGEDVVKITGGKVKGNIDMSASSTADKFVATGGAVTGEVAFGSAAGNTATIFGGVSALDFVLHDAADTTTFIYKAANASTATRLDTINGWSSIDDHLDLSAFVGPSAGASVHQTITGGNDFISVAGTAFKLELVGVGTAISASQIII
jgi:hypothetical protein